MRSFLNFCKKKEPQTGPSDVITAGLSRVGALCKGISYLEKDAINFKEAFSGYTLIDEKHYPISGERFPTSQHCIYALSKILQPESYLEIGTKYGYSLGSVMLGSNRLSHAISIDIDTALNKVRQNIDSLGKNVVVELIKSDSRSFDTDQEFDLCYVDGDHSYEMVLHDLKKFWKNVKGGGVMANDDTIRKRVDGSVPPVYVLEAALEFLKTADNVENYFLQYPSFSGFGIIAKT